MCSLEVQVFGSNVIYKDVFFEGIERLIEGMSFISNFWLVNQSESLYSLVVLIVSDVFLRVEEKRRPRADSYTPNSFYWMFFATN